MISNFKSTIFQISSICFSKYLKNVNNILRGKILKKIKENEEISYKFTN